MRANGILEAAVGTAVLAVPLSVYFWRVRRRCQATFQWRSAPCTILESRVEQYFIKETRTNYHIRVRFRYEYEGRTYDGDRFDYSLGSFGESKARAIVESLPAGAATECRVNPECPSDAVLKAGGFERVRFVYIVLLCFLFPALAAIGYGIWLKIR